MINVNGVVCVLVVWAAEGESQGQGVIAKLSVVVLAVRLWDERLLGPLEIPPNCRC